VIYAQGYLLYFPESAEAYRLLGDARTREGNLELALNAYSRAIETATVESVTESALISRAALYRQQNRPRLAVRDLTAAIAIADRPSTRALRMNAAYAARNYAFAAEDAQALLGTGAVSDGEALLMQARVQIDRADDGETQAYSEALNLLNNAADLPEPLVPVAEEYRARALYALGSYSDALNAINRALVLETGSRHYLRGLIFEGLQQFDQAIAEFNWVLTWSAVYPYPFAEDARIGITRVQETIAELNRQATATSRGATQAAIDLTETRSAATTATAEAATQAAAATATARALPTPTRTPIPGGS
jgi:tetratricopeptide (TPR) repeat protein